MDKLRFGTALKLWNILINLLVAGAAAVVTVLALPQVILVGLTLIGGGLGLWALFLVTAAEPTVGWAEDPITLRKVVRSAAVLGLIGEMLNQTGAGALGTWILLVAFVGAVAGVVALFGEFVCFRRFARRIPDEQLANNTTIVMWGFVAATAQLICQRCFDAR